jgi:hypothetical protein
MAAVGTINLVKEKKQMIARRASSGAKLMFADDQVVHATEVQRNWKKIVESRLPMVDFLVMYSGKAPKAVILEYDKFVALWRKAQELADRWIELEATQRVLRAGASGKPLTTLKELAGKAGITQEELENTPDVELIPE